MALGRTKERVFVRREEGSLGELPPVVLELPGEALKSGTHLTVEGLGVPQSEGVIVSPTLGIVGHRVAGSLVNKTSVRAALRQ